MVDWKKDAWGSIAVAAVAIVLFLASMASMARLGQSTGESFRGRAVHGPGDPGAPDSTTATAVFRRDTTSTVGEVATSVVPNPAAAISFESSAPDARSLFGTPQPGPANGVPVLCYHYLRHAPGPFRLFKVLLYVVLSLPVLDDNEMWTQSEGAFEKQMRWLHENGYRTVTLEEMTAWQYGHRPLPPKSVVITFDDGDRSVYDYAWPILQKYGFSASYFIITRQVGEEWRGLHFLSWDELREMADSGTFTIESHTHDLHYKVGDKHTSAPVVMAAERGLHSFDGFEHWEDRVRDDLGRSRHMVELKIGRSPRYLAWPYGHSNPYVDEIARDVGFDRTVLLVAGANPSFVPVDGDTIPRVDRIPVRRYTISARTSLRTFKQMVMGEYVPPDASY